MLFRALGRGWQSHHSLFILSGKAQNETKRDPVPCPRLIMSSFVSIPVIRTSSLLKSQRKSLVRIQNRSLFLHLRLIHNISTYSLSFKVWNTFCLFLEYTLQGFFVLLLNGRSCWTMGTFHQFHSWISEPHTFPSEEKQHPFMHSFLIIVVQLLR